jgi:hypothetical protein
MELDQRRRTRSSCRPCRLGRHSAACAGGCGVFQSRGVSGGRSVCAVQLPPSPAFISVKSALLVIKPDYGGSIIWPVRDLALARDAWCWPRVSLRRRDDGAACARFPRRVYPDRPHGRRSAGLSGLRVLAGRIRTLPHRVHRDDGGNQLSGRAPRAIVSSESRRCHDLIPPRSSRRKQTAFFPRFRRRPLYAHHAGHGHCRLSLGLLFLLWFWRRGAKSFSTCGSWLSSL